MKGRKTELRALVVLALALGACGGQSSGPTTQQVGPAGGTVQSDGVTINVPPGALDHMVDVQVTQMGTNPANAVGPAFVLEPEGTAFKTPVTVTLPFAPNQLKRGVDSGAVRVYTAAKGSSAFTALKGNLVDATHIQVTTTHFSVWYAGTPAPTTLAQELNFPSALAVDGTSVYWLDSGMPGASGRVMKAPLGGGEATTLADGQVDPKRLAIAAGYLYWTTGGHKEEMIAGTVMRLPVGGGPAETVALGLAFPRAIAVDATDVYFSDYDEGKIYRAAIAGGGATAFAEAQAKVESIALDDTTVYFTASGNGTVMKAAKAGGAPVALATAQGSPAGIAVDATTVYWVNQGANLDAIGKPVNDGTGAVRKVAKAGGDATDIATGQWKPYALAVETDGLYWVNAGNGTVSTAPLAGGATGIVGDQALPFGIVLDAANVYWVNNGNSAATGSVATLAK